MAQLAAGIAGGVVGSFFGMPQLGFALGSAIGGIAFAPKPPNPEVGSLAPTEVEYGFPIPRVFGTRRMPGWRLYQSELEAVSQRVETKGSSSRTVGYRYRCNMGLLICRAGVQAAVRIWRNKEMVATFRTDADWEDIAASLISRHWQEATFYPGDDDQLPHPAYEADPQFGGNVPAYRGWATIWFDGAWCEGRTPPAIEVEVTTGPEDGFGVSVWTLISTDNGTFSRAPGSVGYESVSVVPVKSAGRFIFNGGGYGGVSTYATKEEAIAFGYSLSPTAIEQTGSVLVDIDPAPTLVSSVASGGEILETYRVNGTIFYFSPPPGSYAQNAYEWSVSYTNPSSTFDVLAGMDYSTQDIAFDASADGMTANTDTPDVEATLIAVAGQATAYVHTGYNNTRYVLRDGIVYLGSTTEGAKVWRYVQGTGTPTHEVTVAAFPLTVGGLACDGTTLYVLSSTLKQYNAADLTSAGPDLTSPPGSVIFCNSAGNLYCYDSQRLYQYTAGSWNIVLDVTGSPFNGATMLHPPLYEGGLMYAIQSTTGPSGFLAWEGILSLPAVTPEGVALNTILANYAEACGINLDQVNLAETAGITVEIGYTAQGTGKFVFDELSTAYNFMVLNDGYGIKTRLRGQASVATITYEDLGAGVDQPADEPIEPDTDSAAEVPRRISVSAANGDADHQVETQTDDRILGPNVQTDSLSLNLSITPKKIKGIANSIAADRKTAANVGLMAVGLKYIDLELGDIVTVVKEGEWSRRVRLVRESFADYVRQFDWVLDRAADIQDEGIVSEAGAAEPTLTIETPGIAEVLPIDSPLERDADNTAGQYVAVDLRDGADFAGIYHSSTADVSFENAGNVSSEAAVGTLLTSLRAWDGRYSWDGASTFDVLMADGATLTSSTKSAMSLDLSINNILIGSTTRGWERARFINATLIATNTFRVSVMLRAMKGTEALAFSHIPGERLIVLSLDGVRSVNLDLSAAGTHYWKAVAPGRNVTTTPAVSSPFESVRTKPLSPTRMRANRDGSGDVTFTWSPRTRFGTNWNTATFPNSELLPQYRVEVFAFGSFGTPVRVQIVTAASFTYTSAQQSADGVIDPNRIAIRIRALGPTGQAGTPLESVI
jgi:hypothetical protein